MRRRIIFLFLILIVLMSSVVLSLTANDYFEFASTKYLEGDNNGALSEINKALAIDKAHAGALDLRAAILQERAAQTPLEKVLASPTVVTPKPEIKEKVVIKRVEAPPVIVEKIIERIVERKRDIAVPKVEESRNEVLVVGTTFSIIIGALLALLFWRVIYGWFHSSYVYCSECRGINQKNAEFCKKCGLRLKAAQFTDEQKQWFDKFHWNKNPFTLNVMPNTYAGHQTEIAIIEEKLNTLSGHILVVGGLGTGKTTLLQLLERHLKGKFETIYLVRPPARPEEVIDLIAATISKKTKDTRKYSVYEFRNLCKKYKKNILILLDEAHELNDNIEQFIRILGDLHNVFLVLAGLPQTRECLKRDLPALFDRIVESILLGALSREETRELIQKRILNASGKGLGPFTVAAVDKIYDLGFGIPRGILKICDWIVTQAIKENKTQIDAADIVKYNEEMKRIKLNDTGGEAKNE